MQPHADKPAKVRSVPDEQQPPHGEPRSQLPSEIHPLIQQAQQAFHRDLPQLIEERYRQWVAYHGERRLGFAKTKTELYQKCLRLGLTEGEFLVESIEPEVPAEFDAFADV